MTQDGETGNPMMQFLLPLAVFAVRPKNKKKKISGAYCRHLLVRSVGKNGNFIKFAERNYMLLIRTVTVRY